MPDLSAIEEFKLIINSLGKEPLIVAKEGGTIEDVSPIPPDGILGNFSGDDENTADDFSLDDRLSEADVEEETEELVPDLGGFDFDDDDDNPFGDLGDFTLDDDDDSLLGDDFNFDTADYSDESEPQADELAGEETNMDDFTGDLTLDEDTNPDEASEPGEVSELAENSDIEDIASFSDLTDAEEISDLDDSSIERTTFPDPEGLSDELPETMGDLFEDGSEEAIPDFVATEQVEEELSFDDFTLDTPGINNDLEDAVDLEDVEDLLPLDENSEEDIPELDGDFDLSDDSEISLGNDFDSDLTVEADLDEIVDFEPVMDFNIENDELDDFDLSPGDFGEPDEIEDYSFGEELDAVDEMKVESSIEADFEITDEQFINLQRNLSTLPRNLKITVEEVIAEQKMKGKKYEKMIMLLVDGASPREIADYLLKTINKKIKLPSGYMKKSGLELEKSKSGFAYIFSHHTWPVLRWILMGITTAWILAILSLLFLYRPLHARQLYSKGYDNVYLDQYSLANDQFEEAWNGWFLGPFFIDGWHYKNWFYKYADAYRDRRQFIEAARKYDELLTFYPDDIKGMMDYAQMETYDTANYEHAEEILKKVLGVKVNDYKAMLAFGDNYFEWSDEDPTKLEDARFVYATILDDRGGKSDVLLRMLRYFLRRNDDENIIRLKDTFQKDQRKPENPSYFSTVYSELGGYFLDKGEPAEALTILLRAEKEYDEIPDVHYQLARYFRVNENNNMEELALRKVLFYLDHQTPLKKDKIFMKLDTHRRRGELKFKREELLDAENEYRQGIALYENSIIRNLIGASSTGGKLYADLGELYYQNQDYMAALNMYDRAEKNRYLTPDIEYHRGYSTYITGNYERALLEFYNAEQGLPGNRNVLFALGNTMLKRENYYGAQSAYSRVINQLKEEENNIGYLQINEKPQHKALIELYSRSYQNLGVAYYKLAKSSTDVDKISLAMACFTKASDYSDLLSRDRDTQVREDEPQTYDSAESYITRDSNNILDGAGYKVDAEYQIPRNVDDIQF